MEISYNTSGGGKTARSAIYLAQSVAEGLKCAVASKNGLLECAMLNPDQAQWFRVMVSACDNLTLQRVIDLSHQIARGEI